MMQVGAVATVSIDCRACGSVPGPTSYYPWYSISVRLYIPRFVSVTIPCILARIPGIKMTTHRILTCIPGSR